MKSVRLGAIGLIVVVLFVYHLSAQPAFGDAVLVADNRSVSTSGSWRFNPFVGTPSSGSWNLSALPLSEFVTFNSKVIAPPNPSGFIDVFGEQISSITSTRFEAVGTAHIRAAASVENCSSAGCSMGGQAGSVFEVTFTLVESHDFQLTSLGFVGQMYLDQVGVGRILTVPHSSTSLLTTGALLPGSYVLHADDIGSFGLLNGESYNNCGTCPPLTPDNPNYYHLSFQMQTVPEPPAIVLLSMSLLSLAGFTRTLKRRVDSNVMQVSNEQKPIDEV